MSEGAGRGGDVLALGHQALQVWDSDRTSVASAGIAGLRDLPGCYP